MVKAPKYEVGDFVIVRDISSEAREGLKSLGKTLTILEVDEKRLDGLVYRLTDDMWYQEDWLELRLRLKEMPKKRPRSPEAVAERLIKLRDELFNTNDPSSLQAFVTYCKINSCLYERG